MRNRLFLVTLVLALAALACNFPGSNPASSGEDPLATATQPGEDPGATQPAIEPSATRAEESPAQADEATATATPPGWSDFNYNGLRFRYPPELFTSFDNQILPAETGEAGMPGWPGSVPEQIQVKITGYPLQNTFHTPRINLYPIEVYAAVNSAAGDIAGRLEGVLDQGSFEPKNLPFLPMFNAGQMFASGAESFPFQNGRGIRFLTCYTQSVIPVDSECLFYTYQGLTTDGEYYISAILPVSLPALETADMKAAYEDATVNFDEARYESYLDRVFEVFDSAGPSDYTPNLDVLDEVMLSLRAEPEVGLKAPELSGVNCPGAMAQRLQPDQRVRVTYTNGTPLRVRQLPGKSAAVLGQIPEGATMVVIGGPQCVSEGLWWKIRVDGGDGLEGWVLEGEGGEYYVEPWN